MKNVVITKEMQCGPTRVPVMMRKGLADRLATYLLQHGRSAYDENLERIICAGLDAISGGAERSRRKP